MASAHAWGSSRLRSAIPKNGWRRPANEQSPLKASPTEASSRYLRTTWIRRRYPTRWNYFRLPMRKSGARITTMTKGNRMLTQPTIEKLNSMKLTAMARAFADQMQCPDMALLSFEERFGLIVDYQMTDLDNRRMQNRLRNAKLRLSASIEDLDFRQGRGVDRSQVMSLAGNQWVKSHHNILVTGPTGAGKSYLACALAQKACRDGPPSSTRECRDCFRRSRCPDSMAATARSLHQ